MRVLLLGGTTEAGAMARALAESGIDAVYSYAGRTAAPLDQPLPQRIGGFGGVEGLVRSLRQDRFTHVIDATHPFAAQMSRNAVAACEQCPVPLIALERPPWAQSPGDLWTRVPDMAAAVAQLPDAPTTVVFLAIGRQEIGAFASKPQHQYLLRFVDAPDNDLVLPNTRVIVARGPFDLAGDLALLKDHGVRIVVTKNAGGSGAQAKLVAARTLGLPVIIIDRPQTPDRASVPTVQAVMDWLHGVTDRGV